jgi:hypothetical protein
MANPWYATKGYDSVGTHRLAALTHDERFGDDGMTKEAERWRLVFIHDGQKHAVTAGDGEELGRKVQAQVTQLGIPYGSAVSQDIGRCLLHAMSHPLSPARHTPAQQMGTLLDTLAVLRETAGALRLQLTRHLANYPELIRGSKTLTVEDRIQNTVANRRAMHETLQENHPLLAPEVFILAGAQVALGGSAPDLGRVVAECVQTPGLTEHTFRQRLETREPSRVSQSARHDYEPGE